MKLGIISDTHGHLNAWTDACSKFFQGADMILHAGDVLYHGPRNPRKADYDPAELIKAINACSVPVIIAKGNCDSDVDASCLEVPIQALYAYVVAEGLRIIITHGDAVMTDAEKDAMAAHLKADLFISGHTHLMDLDRRPGGAIVCNSGSITFPKGGNPPSFLTLEDGILSLRDLDGKVLKQLAL